MIRLASAVIPFFLALFANAQSIEQCTNTDRKAPVSTICISSKGVKFQRYMNLKTGSLGWLDLNAKIVWYDHLYYGRSITAFDYCNGQPLVPLDIPQNSELIAATKNGAAEILRSNSEVWSWQQSRWVLYSFKMNCEFYFPPFKDISECFTKSMYTDESKVGICVERI